MTDLATKFHILFSGLERAYGKFTITSKDGDKLRGKAETVVGEVTDALWEQHLAGEQGLGVVPITDRATVKWAVIDIDHYSNFDIVALEKKIVGLKLPLIPCRTKSGGAHVFVFFSSEVDAGLVRSTLTKWSYLLGYPKQEIFPKQNKLANPTDCGNWLNMPYFNTVETSRYGIRDGAPLSAEEFLDYVESKKIDARFLEDYEIPEADDLKGAPPCIQHLARIGVVQGNGRHNFLFDLAIYAIKRFPDSYEETVRAFNRKYISPSLSSRDVKTTLDSVSKKKDSYFYKCKDIPLHGVCNKDLCKDCEFGIGGGEDDPGVLLKSLTKYLTDPPIWILNINGSNVEIQDTDQFLSQNKFKRLCVDKLNIIPTRVKESSWDQIIRELLADVTSIVAPVGASAPDQIWAMVDRFCTDKYISSFQEELLNGNAYRDDEFIYFRSIDLVRFLETERHAKINIPVLWSQIQAKGGGSQAIVVKGKTITCWTLPRKIFTEQTEDFPVRVPNSEF